MPLLFGNTASSGSAIDGLSAATAAPSGLYLRNTLGITTDGTYWLNPTGSNAFQAYVINSRDGGGWVKAISYNNSVDLSTSNAVNQNGSWVNQERGLYAGKLRTADFNALQTSNAYLMRCEGSPASSGSSQTTDNLFNNGAGTGKLEYTIGNLPSWGTDLDPTGYTLRLSTNSSSTYQFFCTYTNDPQGRCGHGSSQFQWISDHNYFSSSNSFPAGLGIPICWGHYPQWTGTNLHWMSGIANTQSGGEIYWGKNAASGFYIYIR